MPRRPPKRITPARLRRMVAHYLDRYATTEAHLRRLFQRRIRRAAAHHDDDPAEGERLLEDEIRRVVRLGLVDDAQFAVDRGRRLLRRGNGPRQVRAKLRAKGVSAQCIDEAMERLTEELGDPAHHALLRYARRRRLGPFGPHPDPASRPPEISKRQLGKLARAGFSYDQARRVLDAASVDELEAG